MAHKQSWIRTGWRRWKRVAHKIGDYQARFLLVVFYYIVMAPFGIIMRWKSDPLSIKKGACKGWQCRPPSQTSPLEQALRQF